MISATSESEVDASEDEYSDDEQPPKPARSESDRLQELALFGRYKAQTLARKQIRQNAYMSTASETSTVLSDESPTSNTAAEDSDSRIQTREITVKARSEPYNLFGCK